MELENELEHWLRMGLGRAVLWLREHNAATHRDLIARAVREDWRYDRQIDDPRGQYIYDVAQAAGLGAYCRDLAIASLNPLPEDVFNHRLSVVAAWARAGDEQAHDALYRAFRREAANGEFGVGSWLIEVDGLSGFEEAVTTYLQETGAKAETDEIETWLYDLEDWNGDKQAQAEAQTLASKNVVFDLLLKSVFAEREDRRAKRQVKTIQPAPEYAEIVAQINLYMEKCRETGEQSGSGKFRSIGRRASEDAIERLAHDLRRETDPVRLLPLLQLFGHRELPGDLTPLLEWVWSADEDIVLRTVRVLEQRKDPCLRPLAHAMLADGIVYGAYLLERNGLPDDFLLIERFLHRSLSDDEIHSLDISLRTLCKERWHDNAISTLSKMYEREHCGFCRGEVTVLLAEHDALPDAWFAECEWDAYPDTRTWWRDETEKRRAAKDGTA